ARPAAARRHRAPTGNDSIHAATCVAGGLRLEHAAPGESLLLRRPVGQRALTCTLARRLGEELLAGSKNRLWKRLQSARQLVLFSMPQGRTPAAGPQPSRPEAIPALANTRSRLRAAGMELRLNACS